MVEAVALALLLIGGCDGIPPTNRTRLDIVVKFPTIVPVLTRWRSTVTVTCKQGQRSAIEVYSKAAFYLSGRGRLWINSTLTLIPTPTPRPLPEADPQVGIENPRRGSFNSQSASEKSANEFSDHRFHFKAHCCLAVCLFLAVYMSYRMSACVSDQLNQ